MSNLAKWLLLAFGAVYAKPLLAAFESVDPELPLEDSKTALCNAVQGCHDVSGTLRGWICKAIKACRDQMTLAILVGQIVRLLEKYAPV